jgi:hypothetical protein
LAPGFGRFLLRIVLHAKLRHCDHYSSLVVYISAPRVPRAVPLTRQPHPCLEPARKSPSVSGCAGTRRFRRRDAGGRVWHSSALHARRSDQNFATGPLPLSARCSGSDFRRGFNGLTNMPTRMVATRQTECAHRAVCVATCTQQGKLLWLTSFTMRPAS